MWNVPNHIHTKALVSEPVLRLCYKIEQFLGGLVLSQLCNVFLETSKACLYWMVMKNTTCRPATMIWHKISINDQKNLYFRKKNLYEYGQYKKKTFGIPEKKSVFRLILGGKICILPNSGVKKSVYTDKICMSGRSGYKWQVSGLVMAVE